MKVDNILFINLDHDVLRRKNIESELNNFNLKYVRIPGICGNKGTIRGNPRRGHVKGNIDGIKYDFKGVMKTHSRVGCMLSHLKAIIYAKQNLKGNTMILEDDISLSLIENFAESFGDILKEAPDDWNILKIHCNNSPSIKRLYLKYNAGEKFSELLNKNVINNSSAGCNIINEKGINALYDKYFDNETKTWVIDEDYVLADIVTFYIDKVYTYNKPVCLNFITKSNNYVGENRAEIKANMCIKTLLNK